MLLEVEELGKDYGKTRAVGAVDLHLQAGDILGLLGPNGAGKTTTISMIAGIVTPTRGTARVDGHDVRRRPFAARRALGFVPQELAVYGALTARQNLRFFASLYRVPRGEVDAAIDWALDLAGLTDWGERPVRTFSGGMKRRLNLVAGLIHRPRLLILDEPTVGVDPQSRTFLFEAIRALAAEGMGVLYTSHYMEEVEALCKRVAVIDHGDVIAHDSVGGLLAAHAAQTVAIYFRDEDGRAREGLAMLQDVSVDAGCVSVPDGRDLADVVACIEQAGGHVTRVESSHASLETVFLHLTGRHLRDAS